MTLEGALAISHYECEFTDDGNLQHSTRSVQQAQQAYRKGNIQPLLHLLVIRA